MADPLDPGARPHDPDGPGITSGRVTFDTAKGPSLIELWAMAPWRVKAEIEICRKVYAIPGRERRATLARIARNLPESHPGRDPNWRERLAAAIPPYSDETSQGDQIAMIVECLREPGRRWLAARLARGVRPIVPGAER